MIPESFIQELIHRVDIVDLIDGYVPLKKAGANYSACCPFHNEKTPSFTVSPTKQFYHCFGCGAHGNAIGFLMAFDRLEFRDAVAELAADAGLDLPSAGDAPPPHHQALRQAMDAAAHFYRQQLRDAPRAIDYLKRRGLSGATAAAFGTLYRPPKKYGT